MDYLAGPASDIPEGGRKLVRCGEAEIGIFRIGGALQAWHNVCPHRQGPVCTGRINPKVIEPIAEDGTTRMLAFDAETMHLACPWHGYEFDLATGRNVIGRAGALRAARIWEEDGELHVSP